MLEYLSGHLILRNSHWQIPVYKSIRAYFSDFSVKLVYLEIGSLGSVVESWFNTYLSDVKII